MIIRELDPHSQLLLLWVQNFNDLCDGPCIKGWDDAAAGRQKLQLECLWYCSLENKVRHVQLRAVRGLYRDHCYTGIGV